jgi:hypothetical protein
VGATPLEVECDLDGYQRRRVVEMIGRTPLPPVSDARYAVGLGPHECGWFQLRSGQ